MKIPSIAVIDRNAKDGKPDQVKPDSGGDVGLTVGGFFLCLMPFTDFASVGCCPFFLIAFGFSFLGVVHANSAIQRILGIVFSGLAGAGVAVGCLNYLQTSF